MILRYPCLVFVGKRVVSEPAHGKSTGTSRLTQLDHAEVFCTAHSDLFDSSTLPANVFRTEYTPCHHCHDEI